MIPAWHFRSHREHSRGVPVHDGEWIEHKGRVEICSSGLHASRRAIDALGYADGSYVSLCEIDDIVEEHGDKLVCRRRRHLWTYDAELVLLQFARQCALDVVHLWDAPEVVLQYLKADNELLRFAAWHAAQHSELSHASDAVWSIVRSDDAPNAARNAARYAALAASEAATWASTREAQNKRLESMLLEGVKK